MHILPLSAQEIENRLKNLPENAVVHEYNATSPYPISGVAVAQALASLYTHYVGTEIDASNISGATYIVPNFKVNDIYINTEEKCMYQCTASEPLDDGTGAYRSTWRLVSPVVDQVFNQNSENAVSGTAVNAAISEATSAANNYTDQKLTNVQGQIDATNARLDTLTSDQIDFSSGIDLDGNSICNISDLTFGVGAGYSSVTITGGMLQLENDPHNRAEVGVLTIGDYNGDEVIIRHVADGIEDTDVVTVGQMNNAVSQKSQVQIITWEEND